MKKILATIGIIALCGLVFWGTKNYYSLQIKTSVEEESRVLLEKIEKVSKLITVEGHFSEIYNYEEHWGYDFSPFRKKALIRVKAKVSVGYDLTKMDFKADTKTKTIMISNMPDPEIMSIDHDLDYYDITEGSFNSFEEADYNKMNANAKEKIRKEALNSGLFLSAEAESHELMEIVKFMVEGAGWELKYLPRVGVEDIR
ncbi:MAG: hypothetical protein ACI8YQ_004406 [Polaribacter sp.]|jgi:hypothetical protein